VVAGGGEQRRNGDKCVKLKPLGAAREERPEGREEVGNSVRD
jgi:hypothetical protein